MLLVVLPLKNWERNNTTVATVTPPAPTLTFSKLVISTYMVYNCSINYIIYGKSNILATDPNPCKSATVQNQGNGNFIVSSDCVGSNVQICKYSDFQMCFILQIDLQNSNWSYEYLWMVSHQMLKMFTPNQICGTYANTSNICIQIAKLSNALYILNIPNLGNSF